MYLADSDAETPDVANSLRSYYDAHSVPYDSFSYDYGDGRLWYLADTAMGEYVGDRTFLTDEGYIHASPDGSWEWHDVEYHYP